MFFLVNSDIFSRKDLKNLKSDILKKFSIFTNIKKILKIKLPSRIIIWILNIKFETDENSVKRSQETIYSILKMKIWTSDKHFDHN